VAAHQIGIAPWFDQQKPPVRFRQLWVKRLLTDLPHWRQQLLSYEADAYVAVWLFEPRFGLSQLVAAVADRKQDYDRLFVFGPAQVRALPIEYRNLPGIQDLQWAAYADVEAFLLEDFAQVGRWASRKPHWPGETADGHPYMAVQVGWLWVGQVLV